MIISTNLDAEDCRDFLRFLAIPGSGRVYIGFSLVSMLGIAGAVILSIVASVVAFGIGIAHDAGEFLAIIMAYPKIFWSVILGMLALPVAFWWLRRIYRWQIEARQQAKMGPLDEAFLREGINIGPVRFEFLDAGVVVFFDLVNERYAWDAFKALRESDRSLFLMMEPRSALIVPKRAVRGDAALSALKSMIASHIQAKA